MIPSTAARTHANSGLVETQLETRIPGYKRQNDSGIDEDIFKSYQFLALIKLWPLTRYPKFPHLWNSWWFDSNVAVAWVRVAQFPNEVNLQKWEGFFCESSSPGAFKDSILRPGGPPEPWLVAEIVDLWKIFILIRLLRCHIKQSKYV